VVLLEQIVLWETTNVKIVVMEVIFRISREKWNLYHFRCIVLALATRNLISIAHSFPNSTSNKAKHTGRERGRRGRGRAAPYRRVARAADGDPVTVRVVGVPDVRGRQELEAPEHHDGGDG
jgi:hypothetical protein